MAQHCVSPYQSVLEEMKNRVVVLHRAGATDIRGKVIEVAYGGCILQEDPEDVLKRPNADPDRLMHTFIAYEDIRGIATDEIDANMIG